MLPSLADLFDHFLLLGLLILPIAPIEDKIKTSIWIFKCGTLDALKFLLCMHVSTAFLHIQPILINMTYDKE